MQKVMKGSTFSGVMLGAWWTIALMPWTKTLCAAAMLLGET